MIKANELRIGNLVYGPLGEIMVIDQIGSKDYKDYIHATCLDNSGSGQNGLSPIPLIEELLVKAGAEESEILKGYSLDGYYLLENIGGTGFNVYTEAPHIGELCFIAHCEYAHEFQNLYFDLKGEELDFKM